MRSSWLAIFIAVVCISLSGVPIHAQKACFLTLLPAERLKLIDKAIDYHNWRGGGVPEGTLYQLGYTVVFEGPGGTTVTFINPYTGSKLEFPTRPMGGLAVNLFPGEEIPFKIALETNGNFKHRFFDHAYAEGMGEFKYTEHNLRETEFYIKENLILEAGFQRTWDDYNPQSTERVVRFTRFRDGAQLYLRLWGRVGMFDFGIENRRQFENVIRNGGTYVTPNAFPYSPRMDGPFNFVSSRPPVVLGNEPKPLPPLSPVILLSTEPERPVNTPKIIP